VVSITSFSILLSATIFVILVSISEITVSFSVSISELLISFEAMLLEILEIVVAISTIE